MNVDLRRHRRAKKRRVLAIDPGTRHLGLAVLDDSALVYRGVWSLRKRHSPHETLRDGKRLIARLIGDFRPEMLVVEKAFFAKSRNTALLNVFVDEIRALGRRTGLEVLSFAPSTVKKTVTGSGKASKRAVARVVVSRYPELRAFIGQDRKWKERYHSNMFDAVALGITANESFRAHKRAAHH